MKSTLLVLTASLMTFGALAQGTAISYQGRLDVAGTPANGLYDLSFSLEDQVGNHWGSLTNLGVRVSNGVFTVTLDFGPAAFNNGTRWLEVAVRPNTGGVFNLLAPRQQILPAPYTIYATSAGVAGTINGILPASSLAGLYPNPVNLDHLSNRFTGSFTGNGSGLTSVNALTLGGLGPANFWKTRGNAGTVPGTDFLGTLDARPLDLRANNSRGLRLEHVARALLPPFSGSYGGVNVIGGAWPNHVSAGAMGATIAGGGQFNEALVNPADAANWVTGDYGTIGGGMVNQAGGGSTVAGGVGNTASGTRASVAGGEQNQASGEYSTIGGGSFNLAAVIGAFVGGGYRNEVSATNGVIGGGISNSVTGDFATVAGGSHNRATGRGAFVGGGGGDPITGELSAILGNLASGPASAVAGGEENIAHGWGAAVPGGVANQAWGNFSLAAGNQARANHHGAFVWSSYANPAPSFEVNRFHVLAPNGFSVDFGPQRGDGGGSKWVAIGPLPFAPGNTITAWNLAGLSDGGIWQNASDRNRKTDFAEVSPSEVLSKVMALPVRTWRYTNEADTVRHLGPVAQDFKAAFGLGTDDKSIGTVDADGVALAAIQGLNQKLAAELQGVRAQNADLKARVEKLEHLIEGLSATH